MKKIIILFVLCFTSIQAQGVSWFWGSDGTASADTIPSQFTFVDVTDADLESYHEAYIVVAGCDSGRFWSEDSMKVGELASYDIIAPVWVEVGDTIYMGNVASGTNSTATHKVVSTAGGTVIDTFSVTTVAGGSSYEPEIDAMILALSTQLEDSVYDALNNHISHFKDSLTIIMGYSVTLLSQVKDWTFITSLPTSEATKYDLTGNGFTWAEVSTPTYTAFEGITGNGSGAGFQIGWNPTDDAIQFQQDSGAVTIYIRTNAQENKILVGNGGLHDILLSPYRAGDVFRGNLNDVGFDALLSSVTSSGGMYTVSRLASNAKYGFRNFTYGSVVSTASTGLMTVDLYILSAESSAHQVSYISMGQGMTAEMHRAETNCFETFIMDRWGKGVIE